MSSPAGTRQEPPVFESTERPNEQQEVSLIDILLVLARNSRLIAMIFAVVVSLGVTYAILAPSEFSSYSQVIREADVEAPAGLAGGLSALRGLGVSLGGSNSGLTPDAYPEVLKSRDVRLGVARDTFYFPELEREMTYVERIQVPGLLDRVKDPIAERIREMLGMTRKDSTISSSPYPQPIEVKAADLVGSLVSSSVDRETGLMAMSVTTSSPDLSAAVASSYLHHLEQRVRSIRTQKARKNLAFIEERFNDVQEELRDAEQQLAEFTDRNQNLNSARLRTERDRLQRQVRFKSDLFSEIQTQRTQAQIELQRVSPVVTVVQAPIPPLKPSAPSRMLIVVLSVMLGGLLGVGSAFLRSLYTVSPEDDADRSKIEELQEWTESFTILRRARAHWNRFTNGSNASASSDASTDPSATEPGKATEPGNATAPEKDESHAS